jgi:hypothetical protein
MSRLHDRNATFVEAGKQGVQLRPAGMIKAGGWLVEYKDLRMHSENPCDGHHALLAS